MLSLSADIAQQEIDLQVINGEGGGGIPLGVELMKFAEAVALRDDIELDVSREKLLEKAGGDVVVDAAAVAGNFQRMVRIADATGIPVDDLMVALSGSIPDELNLRRFHSAENTPARKFLQKIRGIPIRFMLQRVARR
jgi:hypothetical protein